MNLKKLVPILGLILIAQVLLALVLEWRSESLAPIASSEKLISLAKTQIEWLRISDKTGKKLTLKKTPAGWIIPDKADFPVDKTKLAGVLEAVLEFKQGYAVGKSETSAKQFRVTSQDFERLLEFGGAGEKVLSSIYFGTSPAFKQVHVRADGGATYLEEYTVFSLALEPRDWLDFSNLNLDQKDIKKVSINDVVVESIKRADATGTDLLVAGAEAKDEFDPEAIKKLVQKASAPIFKDVLGKKNAAEFTSFPIALEWSIDITTTTLNYKLLGPLKTQKDAYALVVSDRDYVYQVSTKELEALKALTRASLKSVPAVQP